MVRSLKTLILHSASVAALFLGALTGVPASAADDDADEATKALPDFDTLDFDGALKVFQNSGDRWIREPCAFGAPLLNVLQDHQPENAAVQRYRLFASALCAGDEGRVEDGKGLIEELNALNPVGTDVEMTLYYVFRTEDADLALETLGNLVGKDFEQLSTDRFWSVVRTIRMAGRGEEFQSLALSWFEGEQIGFINGDLYSALASSALIAAARDGREEMVEPLLQHITSPSVYVDLLTNRDFETIWPQIEERAGDNLADIGAEDVAMARSRLAIAPGDRDRFSDLAYALLFHGEFQAAIDLADTWQDREKRGLALEEGDGWAYNIQAYAYDSLGQVERADAVFDRLAQIKPEGNEWVVNFLINRASRLVGYGRWQEGLEAAGLARTVPGNDYAAMILARDHACALLKLGRREEARTELDFLRENAEESIHLAAQGLLCHGLRDEAAQLLVERLGNSATRGSAQSALAQQEASLFYSPSMLPDPRDLLEEYPELDEAYRELTRNLPERFIPRASLMRRHSDLPDWE